MEHKQARDTGRRPGLTAYVIYVKKFRDQSMEYILIFITGAVIGSFLNVCIYRLPRRESIVYPGSHCPKCNTPIKVYDNIPIISFLLLRGRCRSCGTRIPLQYPAVELLNASAYVLTYWRFGSSWEAAIYSILFSALIVVSLIDLRYKIIPDIITIPGIVTGIVASALVLPSGIVNSVSGVILGGGIFFVAALLSRGGMGGGDIKLLAMMGAFLGWMDVILIVVVSSFLGSIVGIFLMVFHGKGRKHPIPFGPFLAIAGVIAIFFDHEIIRWYSGLIW